MNRRRKASEQRSRFNLGRLYLIFFDPDRPNFSFPIEDWLLLTFSTILGLVTHLLMLGEPNRVIFDEVYFGNFTHYYSKGTYFFDIHPPLGKQLLYFGSKISGYEYGETYSSINAPLKLEQIRRLRLWPALTGALRVPVIYLTLRVLDVTSIWTFVISMFVATDQALIAESRFVLIDAYLSFFACLTMLGSAVIGRRPKRAKAVAVLAGMAAGATVAVKFTGAGTAIALVFAIFTAFPLVDAFVLSAIATISGGAVMLGSFAAHFAMLPNPGPGCKFHPPEWCPAMVQGRTNKIESTIMLLRQMLKSNFAISVKHSYSSKWWQWPLLLGKATYLWVDLDKQLWCVGSPAVWWCGTAGLLLWIIAAFMSIRARQSFWTLFGYTISYLPFCMINRVMWNYHYFIPLLYSLVAGGVAMSTIAPHSAFLPVVLILAQCACYIVWFPITYGTSLPPGRLQEIMLRRWIHI